MIFRQFLEKKHTENNIESFVLCSVLHFIMENEIKFNGHKIKDDFFLLKI